MTRNKWAVLGVSALVLLATGAFVVNGARAESSAPEFTCIGNQATHVACTAHGTNVPIHREHAGGFSSTHTFTTGFATITCKTTTSELTDEDGTSPTPEIVPTYGDCEAGPSNLQVHVDTNGCEYRFHPEETSGGTAADDEYVGSTSVVGCDENEGITVTITSNEFTIPTNEEGATRCLIHIPEQEGIGPIYFRTNTEANPTDVEVEAATARTKSTLTGGFFNCGAGENADSFITGNTAFQVENHCGESIDLKLD